MKRLTDTKVLTACAMLLAIAVIFGFFKIPVSDIVEIRLQFLPVACAGMLFGPAIGGIIGGLTDILAFLIKPTGPYFPGFTISGVVQGMIYGFFLYKKPLTLKRVFCVQLLDSIVISLVLNTIWLAILYGHGVVAVFTARILKTVVMLPVNTFLLMGVLKGMEAVNKRVFEKT